MKDGQEEQVRDDSAPVERIHRLAARMNRLLGDLLDIASIDAGMLSITMTPVDASSFIAEAADAFEKAASARSIALELEVEKPLMLRCDHDRLFQVLANLITNAIKFTPEGGHIEVRGERSGDDVLVSVSDTGPGIPGDMLEAIFERFRQVGKSGSGGLGLGLYISKVIVEAHGGKIWAESQPGEGSKLSFTIPGARPAPG